MNNLDKLVEELCKLPNETPWVEFKHNNYDPNMIGQDISALANSATLHERNYAYMIWGVDDDHNIVGTEYDLQILKKGNQELESWLRCKLSKNADFEFYLIPMHNVNVGVLIIYKATSQTVTFDKVDYIRVGSYTKKLVDISSLQSQLWNRLRDVRYEEQIAKADLTENEVLSFLDCSSYFDLKTMSFPSDVKQIMHYLLEEELVILQDNGLFAITNLGAVLLAKRLSDFSRISRKAVRIVQYNGNNRLNIAKEDISEKGYAIGFSDLMKYIEALIPTEEIIISAFREKKSAYPIVAIREAVANALIHQDFTVTGTGPIIEIFESRIEITNSGIPLVDIRRIIDNPPKSRNEKLADLMRRFRICEELGSGWDKIVAYCELSQLPAPKIDLYNDSTKVTLFSEIPFSNISFEDKLWACYLHSCIKHIQGEHLTNSSLRERFGLKDSSAGNISRLIKEAVKHELIKPLDPNTAPRYMKYLPVWA